MLALLLAPAAFAQAPIINGAPAIEGEWPQTGGLVVGGAASVSGFGSVEGRMLMCSSTLIAPDVVLTAAHCIDVEGLLDAAAVQGYTVENLENLEIVWSREGDLSRYELGASLSGAIPDWPADAAFATDWVAHEGFDLFTLQVGLAENDDIGLIFLDRALDVPFAILPTADEAAEIAEGDDVVIVGWGQQQQDALPGTVGTKQVADSYIAAIADYEFKVGEMFSDGRKCHGDSGGPSFRMYPDTTSSEKHRLIGVTSHAWDATTDCRMTGGVDTRVDYYLDWIDQAMRDACADGTRAWCEEPGILPPPDADGVFPWELDDALADAGEDAEGKGCGCAGVPGASLGWLPLLGLLAIRRYSAATS